MIYERVNWQNGAETPLNKTNLNKMDKAISDLVSELEKLKQLEFLGAFPNLSSCCINNSVNFSSTSGFSVTYGTLDVLDGKLIISSREYASTQLKVKLNKSVVINKEKNILVKLRIKAVAGSNCGVGIYIGLTDGTSVPVTKSCILGSNISGCSLTNGEWTNLWWVFSAEVDTEIESIVLNLYTYPEVEISNIQAFYSLDKATSNTVSNYETITANYDVVETSNEYEVTEKTEVEI